MIIIFEQRFNLSRGFFEHFENITEFVRKGQFVLFMLQTA